MKTKRGRTIGYYKINAFYFISFIDDIVDITNISESLLHEIVNLLQNILSVNHLMRLMDDWSHFANGIA